MNLSYRRLDLPEVMDDPELPNAEYKRCLGDLEQLNWLTRTHQPTLRWLQQMTSGWHKGAMLSVLDVAYGNGDLLRAIHVWARERKLTPVLAGVDVNPRAAAMAEAATPHTIPIAWRVGDVFNHVPSSPPDFIVCSQFVHHLSDADVAACIAWMERHALRGWFIVDIHRHWLPYYGFRFLAFLMGWHRIVRQDGTVSVARGFRVAEWRALIHSACPDAVTNWVFPFRLSAARVK